MDANKHKQVTLTLPADIAQRVMFIRKAGKGDIFASIMLEHVVNELKKIEDKFRIPPDSWKQQKICVKCGTMMVIRPGKDRDKFWGCLDFPKCKHTESTKL